MSQASEKWRPIAGWEGLYSVSNLGRVRSEARVTLLRDGRKKPVPERILRPGKTVKGYAQVHLRRPGAHRMAMISHLVAEAFLGPRPKGFIVRHGPLGNGVDAVENLSYGTHKDNNGPDRLRDGTAFLGEKNPLSKLTEEAVRQIRSSGETTRSLACRYRVSVAAIMLVRHRRTWTHVA